MKPIIPNHILDKMSDVDRAAIGQQTVEEANTKYHARIEREHDKIFASYLHLKGYPFLRANPARKSTIKPGWPDYTIFYDGDVLFIELKSPGKKLREDQDKICKELAKQGFAVHVCYSAAEAMSELDKWAFRGGSIAEMLSQYKSYVDRCEECGRAVTRGMRICLTCGQANQETEDQVNEALSNGHYTIS